VVLNLVPHLIDEVKTGTLGSSSFNLFPTKFVFKECVKLNIEEFGRKQNVGNNVRKN